MCKTRFGMFEEGRVAKFDGSRRTELAVMHDGSARFDILARVTFEEREDGHQSEAGGNSHCTASPCWHSARLA